MRRSATSRAFTLVELLVVVGIIVVLTALLLPVLSNARAQARDIQCQSNLRSIVQGILGYATEHRGSMPYGFYYNRSVNQMHPQGDPNPYHPRNTWREAADNAGSSGDPDNDHPFISWASLVGKYLIRGASADNHLSNFPPVFQCPEAAMTRPHRVGYVMHFAIAISPVYELWVGPAPRAQLKPASLSQMMKETALVWDTAIKPNWENDPGYLISADLDAQQIWDGAKVPQFRYFMISDPFSRIPGNAHGYNHPVKLAISGFKFYNTDPRADAAHPYQGNLRFRHRRDTTCNAGFADGSVRQFAAKMQFNKQVNQKDHNALRRYFIIRWPPGIPPNYSYPH